MNLGILMAEEAARENHEWCLISAFISVWTDR